MIQALVERSGDERQQAVLLEALQSSGQKVLDISAPRTTLEELFLRTVRSALPTDDAQPASPAAEPQQEEADQ